MVARSLAPIAPDRDVLAWYAGKVMVPEVAMTEAVEHLKFQSQILSAPERAELAYFLLASLPPEDARDQEVWQVEVARRVAEIHSGAAVGRPAEGVLAELRERYP